MRIQWLAGTVVLAAALSSLPQASAEIRTDGLSGRQLKVWKAIVAVVEAVGPDGRPLQPTLDRLYRELESSPHVVRIVLPSSELSCAIAGRFRIESLGSDGRHETSITLNLRAIDRVLTGSADAQLVTFETLGRSERYAQVLGHEMAHAVWTLADSERILLVADVQQRSAELARRSVELARHTGTDAAAAAELAATVQAHERIARSLEEPAVAAERNITRELRAR